MRLAYLIFGIVFLIGLVGYVMNITKLVELVSQNEITAMFIVRLVGLIPPIGAILGWF